MSDERRRLTEPEIVARVAAINDARRRGLSNPQVAAELGITTPALDGFIATARRAGHLVIYSSSPHNTPALDQSWKDRAACIGIDPELFFPERGESLREAKRVCYGCEVREACLDYALEMGEKFGVWGGQSERERRRIRRERRLAVAS